MFDSGMHYDENNSHDRELRAAIDRGGYFTATTQCTHCGATAPAIRMPAGQLCHSCQRGVMK